MRRFWRTLVETPNEQAHSNQQAPRPDQPFPIPPARWRLSRLRLSVSLFKRFEFELEIVCRLPSLVGIFCQTTPHQLFQRRWTHRLQPCDRSGFGGKDRRDQACFRLS